MGIIDAFIQFLLGLVHLFIDLIRYVLNFILSLLDMIVSSL